MGEVRCKLLERKIKTAEEAPKDNKPLVEPLPVQALGLDGGNSNESSSFDNNMNSNLSKTNLLLSRFIIFV